MNMDVYWDKVATACAADDYARSKQQQDNRSEACLIIYNARKALALQKGNLRVHYSQYKFHTSKSHRNGISIYFQSEIAESQSVTSERPSGEADSNSDDWILSYEAITEQDINYMRPIVILGPKKDQIMEDLVQDYPQRFGVCIPRK